MGNTQFAPTDLLVTVDGCANGRCVESEPQSEKPP